MVRWLRYRLLIPVFRSRQSAEYTAGGVANGVFWGLTPSVGLQSLAIVATWFVARKAFGRDSSLVQAFIWVWVNNPLTMIPLYYTFYVTGLWLLGDARLAGGYATFADLWDGTGDANWFARVRDIAAAVGIPMVLGAMPYAVVGAGVSYRWTVSVLQRRHARLRDRHEARCRLETPGAGRGGQ